MAQDHLRWVNDPFAQNAASKPLQLHCARKVGLTIPDTLITNDPHMVRDFLKEREGNVIHKALTHAKATCLTRGHGTMTGMVSTWTSPSPLHL